MVKICWSLLSLLLVAVPLLGQCDLKLPGARDASWSPDGAHIVYSAKTKGVQQIFTMQSNGSHQQQLTSFDYPSYYPFYAPDGSSILFMSVIASKSVIMIMASDGSDVKQLTEPTLNASDPNWYPQGKKIIFGSDKDGTNQIYSMNRDGTGWQQITNDTFSNQTPSVSPDGKSILFVSDRDGNNELYTLQLNGGQVTRLTSDPRSDRVPRWSSDSKKVIYYSREPTSVAGSGSLSWSGAELYELNLTDKSRKQLTHNLHLDQSPVYAPNGKKILYTSCASGNREVFVLDLITQEVTQLTHTR